MKQQKRSRLEARKAARRGRTDHAEYGLNRAARRRLARDIARQTRVGDTGVLLPR